jgi:hypothetical protein
MGAWVWEMEERRERERERERLTDLFEENTKERRILFSCTKK